MINSRTTDLLNGARGILFDLDNTLYPREKGVFDYINGKINEYVMLMTGRKGQDVDNLRREYQGRYGTTLGGLMRHERVDAEDYLDFVHNVPVEELLEPDPSLISFLKAIDLPMVIFTNGTRSHAQRVLKAMDVTPFFAGICDLVDTGYLGKPHRKAFEDAAARLGIGLGKAILIDDLPVNVQAGSEYCSFAIHVGSGEDGVGDLHVKRVFDLAPIFAPLPWFRERP